MAWCLNHPTDQSCITLIISYFKHQSYLLKLWTNAKWSSSHDNNKFFTDENYACLRQTISHCTELSYCPTKRTALTFSHLCISVTTLTFQHWANVIIFPLDDGNFGMSHLRIAMYYYRLGILVWNEMNEILWRVGQDLWWLSIFWYTTHKTVRTTSNKNNNSTNSIFHQYRSLAHQYELAIARRIASFADKEGIQSCAVS